MSGEAVVGRQPKPWPLGGAASPPYPRRPATTTWWWQEVAGGGAAKAPPDSRATDRIWHARGPDVTIALDDQEHEGAGTRARAAEVPGQQHEGRRTAQGHGLQPSVQPQDHRGEAAPGPKCPVRVHCPPRQAACQEGRAIDLGRYEKEGSAGKSEEFWPFLPPVKAARQSGNPRLPQEGIGESHSVRGLRPPAQRSPCQRWNQPRHRASSQSPRFNSGGASSVRSALRKPHDSWSQQTAAGATAREPDSGVSSSSDLPMPRA